MKANKYNPKIPVRSFGLPPDWLHPELAYRVTIDIKPKIVKIQYPLGSQYSYSLAGHYIIMSPSHFNEYEYDENKAQVIRDVSSLLPGRHAVHSIMKDRVLVYCDEWIDPVVLKLARIENMGRWAIENRRHIPDQKINHLANSLVSRIV
jgi:hypothetical protein